MAWRIDDAVIRGEIDNRERGCVTGKIWFVGWTQPLALELQGDCWRDLAGRRLEFSNPAPRAVKGGVKELGARQRGRVGDITASRKVKVLDIPLEEIAAYQEAGKPLPWHWGNSLYLEWYGNRNGRVVIERADFVLRVVDDATWEMSPAEEAAQRQANAHAMQDFMRQLGEAAERDDSTGEQENQIDDT